MQTELLQLNPVPFRTTVLEHPVHGAFAKRYAQFFVEQLNKAGEEVSDLEENLVDRQDVNQIMESQWSDWFGLDGNFCIATTGDTLQKATDVVRVLEAGAEKVGEGLRDGVEMVGDVFHRL